MCSRCPRYRTEIDTNTGLVTIYDPSGLRNFSLSLAAAEDLIISLEANIKAGRMAMSTIKRRND
jgi:hypothetical protein